MNQKVYEPSNAHKEIKLDNADTIVGDTVHTEGHLGAGEWGIVYKSKVTLPDGTFKLTDFGTAVDPYQQKNWKSSIQEKDRNDKSIMVMAAHQDTKFFLKQVVKELGGRETIEDQYPKLGKLLEALDYVAPENMQDLEAYHNIIEGVFADSDIASMKSESQKQLAHGIMRQ